MKYAVLFTGLHDQDDIVAGTFRDVDDALRYGTENASVNGNFKVVRYTNKKDLSLQQVVGHAD